MTVQKFSFQALTMLSFIVLVFFSKIVYGEKKQNKKIPLFGATGFSFDRDRSMICSY